MFVIPAKAGFSDAGIHADDAFSLLTRFGPAFHVAVLKIGGRDIGPAVRPDYGAHDDAAVLIDPDGHRLEAAINGFTAPELIFDPCRSRTSHRQDRDGHQVPKQQF